MNLFAPDYNDLMKRYLDVCNQAIALNKDRFPFKQILGAAQKSECDKVIEVNIIDNDSAISYAMTFRKNGLVARPHSTCSSCRCDRKWTIRKTYLEEVTQNPERYIENPAKINWEWMHNIPVYSAASKSLHGNSEEQAEQE